MRRYSLDNLKVNCIPYIKLIDNIDNEKYDIPDYETLAYLGMRKYMPLIQYCQELLHGNTGDIVTVNNRQYKLSYDDSIDEQITLKGNMRKLEVSPIVATVELHSDAECFIKTLVIPKACGTRTKIELAENVNIKGVIPKNKGKTSTLVFDCYKWYQESTSSVTIDQNCLDSVGTISVASGVRETDKLKLYIKELNDNKPVRLNDTTATVIAELLEVRADRFDMTNLIDVCKNGKIHKISFDVGKIDNIANFLKDFDYKNKVALHTFILVDKNNSLLKALDEIVVIKEESPNTFTRDKKEIFEFSVKELPDIAFIQELSKSLDRPNEKDFAYSVYKVCDGTHIFVSCERLEEKEEYQIKIYGVEVREWRTRQQIQ